MHQSLPQASGSHACAGCERFIQALRQTLRAALHYVRTLEPCSTTHHANHIPLLSWHELGLMPLCLLDYGAILSLSFSSFRTSSFFSLHVGTVDWIFRVTTMLLEPQHVPEGQVHNNWVVCISHLRRLWAIKLTIREEWEPSTRDMNWNIYKLNFHKFGTLSKNPIKTKH